jgi:hypothetical protein
MGSKPDRKARTGPRILLGLAVAAVSLSLAGQSLAIDRQAFERLKHPPVRVPAGQFRPLRQGPNAALPNAALPNAALPNAVKLNPAGPEAVESNTRAGAFTPEQRREGVGNIQGEGRPFGPNRASLNPTARGQELQRLETNPGGRGPGELQRPGFPGQNAARGAIERGPGAGGFARRALAERSVQGPGRFGRGALGGASNHARSPASSRAGR